MTTVRNVALWDRTGQAWPLSPPSPLLFDDEPSEPSESNESNEPGSVLLVPADEFPDGLRPTDVVAVSAQHPALQPPQRVESADRRDRPGEGTERWALHLGGTWADAEERGG